jgi:RNA-binding protein
MDSQKRAALRKIGHPMRPLMRMGNKGLTEAFVKELVGSLKAHQLVKVRLDTGAGAEARARAEELAEQAEAEVVDVVGAVGMLYREDPEDPLV